MKKIKLAKKLLAGALTCAMIPLAACSSGPSGSSGSSSPVKTASSGSSELATVSILYLNGGSTLNALTDSRVQKQMAKDIGVKINCVQVDNDKLNVLLAGGDLPDIAMVDTTKFNQLIEGGNVIPLDDLIESHGKDIKTNIAKTVEFSKKYWSDGKNKTYFLPMQVGLDGVAADQTEGFDIRWDYYKELGYPKADNMDDLLNVLSQMVKKHPTTSDGKKVYGVSAFTDWGPWPYFRPMMSIYGFNQINGVDLEAFKVDSGKLYNELEDQDTPYWKCMEFYYKAHKLGILDPDALTQKFDDFTGKLSNGQLVYTFAHWSTNNFNSTNAQKNQGFQVMPLEWGYQWNGSTYNAGWIDKCLSISKSSKNPEKAMDFLNYVYSYDGCRTLYSGVKGTDWKNDNKAPAVTDETIALQQAGGDNWTKTGIGFDSNLIGLSPFTVNPNDKKTVNLFDDSSIFTKTLTPVQKDFSQHYNVSYPEQYYAKLVKDGKVKDQSGTNSFAVAMLPAAPDDIKRTVASLDTLCAKDAAKIILSKSDAEYAANVAQARKDFENAGVKQVKDWYQKAWDKAVQDSQSLK